MDWQKALGPLKLQLSQAFRFHCPHNTVQDLFHSTQHCSLLQLQQGGHPETPEVDFFAHPACTKTHLAPSIPPMGHLNITQSYLVFHNCAWMSITPVKTRQSHSQRTFCPARFFSNEETIFLVSHDNSIRQRIHPATAHSGPSYLDEHVIFVPKYSPSTLLLEMVLCNSVLPKVEMRKITQSRYGYQKQGRQQKQSANNRNNMNS